MGAKLQAIICLLSLMMIYPVSSQYLFDILNLLSGSGQRGELVITTLHNMNPADNRQQITIVQPVDNMVSDNIMQDFDNEITGWDARSTINNPFDTFKKPQIDLINTSVSKMLIKLAKVPNTDPKLLMQIENEMKTVVEEVRRIVATVMDNTDICIGEDASTIAKDGCKAECNEKEIALPRAQRSIPGGYETNQLKNSVKPVGNILTAIDKLIFRIVGHPTTEVNELTKMDFSQKDGVEAGHQCTLEENINCTNFFLDQIIKCSRTVSIAEDRLQRKIYEIVEIVNKLFLSLMNVAFEDSNLSDHIISDKLDMIKLHLKNALDGFTEVLEPSDEYTKRFNNLGEALERVTAPAHHIVGRKLPMIDIGFPLDARFSKTKIPKKYFRQYIPNVKSIQKIESSHSDYDDAMKEELENVFKQIVQSNSQTIEPLRPVLTKTTVKPEIMFNLGKPDSREFTNIMQAIFSMINSLSR